MGQLINHLKCFILFSNNYPNVVQLGVKNSLKITQQVFDPKYLRLPVPDVKMHKKRGMIPFKQG